MKQFIFFVALIISAFCESSLVSGEKKLLELVSGLTFESGVERMKMKYPAAHTKPLFNVGGEHYHHEKNGIEDGKKYIALIEKMEEKNFKASVSVKPTQIGLGVNSQLFADNFEKIAAKANEIGGIGVELDMEQFETIDETLKVFLDVCTKYNDVIMRLAVPAEFRRSLDIARQLGEANCGARVVRGKAYADVPKSEIFEDIEELNNNYIEMTKQIPPKRLAIATGNLKLLERVYNAIGKENINVIEHQLLFGLPYHAKAAEHYIKNGLNVAFYVPIGEWEKVRPYVLRRKYLTEEEYKALDKKYNFDEKNDEL